MSEGLRKKDLYGAPMSKSLSDDRRSVPPPLETATNIISLNPSPPRKKAVIKSADMKDDMQKEAIDIAISAFEKFNVEKDIAEHIKKEFDKKHGATWHCIVGRNFGSYVTHETNHFVYFYLDQKAVLLFKSG
ncbi:PREDICTED: dynein light chain 1, cytoplasmic-like [Tarenaya hassleriana]|uniref:dynein light chain 1, cytoplasmic-like n=1 Tax=Tarenaya hassleriana TaxID=28532 RepID=UPI00053C2150|nr:PREDICTED: dynein light chain 1, cytoplasmic-like [Tarenaya hassleriana]